MLPRPAFNAACRSFSTTACRSANFISNIGKQPIKIPSNVTVDPTPAGLAVSGPLGSTSVPFPNYVKLDFDEPQSLIVSVEDRTNKIQRSIWGRTRTLISNAITGMTEGFTTPMYLVGVGYRAALEEDPMGKRPGWSGQRLNMKLGFSHPVLVPIPDYIKIQVASPTKILASGTDKQILGLFTASVRKNRPPEPYKGKVRPPFSVCCSRPLKRAFTLGYYCWAREGQNQGCQEEVDIFPSSLSPQFFSVLLCHPYRSDDRLIPPSTSMTFRFNSWPGQLHSYAR